MSLGVSLALVPLLIGLNAFFVAAEYAVVAIRPPQVEAMGRAGWRRAAAAMGSLKESPASAIGAIQVCITMTNLMLGWIGEPAMGALLMKLFGPAARVVPAGVFETASFVASFVVVTLLTVVFSELLPKALTLRYVTVAATATAVPVLVLARVTRPLVWVMNAMANAVTRPLGLGRVDEGEEEGAGLSVAELRVMARQAGERGLLTERASALVQNSLTIGERRARDVMVPRTKVAYLDLNRSMEENRRVMNERLFTWLPLCQGGLDHVVGVVPVKEFLAAYHAEADVRVLQLIARRATFAPEGVPLDRLLEQFGGAETGVVLLVDEYGGMEGLVTLRDVINALVGGTGGRSR